ncbi:MAG TPA: ATP-binding protein [Thermoanaerobaculia bacterium]|nr:ATP-binding protein [Thermoanaerobaculia bacterium]
MSAAPVERRPIARRIMLALFLLMMVPIVGWYFFADLAARRWETLPLGAREPLLALQQEIRFKLALTLGASVAMLAAVVLYVRRSVLDRLEALAARARKAPLVPPAPEEAIQPDEIGDLSQALDEAVGRLLKRGDDAIRFAGDLSHELKTPLAAIRGAGEILAGEELSTAERRRFATHVLEESARLERLVAGMVELARAERPPAASTGEPLALAPLLVETAERIRPFEPGLAAPSIVLEPDAGLPEVGAAPDNVRRILVILLENAFKYAGADGTIRLRAFRDGDDVIVAVDDGGPGVPPALREKVFDRFFTTDASAAVPARGAGLGLAIARSLVEGFGGRIFVESSSSGGASFRFSIPVARPHLVSSV